MKFDILMSKYLHEQVNAPPRAEATRIRNSKPTAFRKFYERGDFPIALEHDTKGNKIAWKVLPFDYTENQSLTEKFHSGRN